MPAIPPALVDAAHHLAAACASRSLTAGPRSFAQLLADDDPEALAQACRTLDTAARKLAALLSPAQAAQAEDLAQVATVAGLLADRLATVSASTD